LSETYAIQALFGEGRPEFVDHVPHARAIGIECVRVDACEAVLKIPYRDDLVGDPTRGVVFGGVITTLLDQAGGVATFCSLPEITTIATIDLRIDYLRAAEPGADLFGRAFCYKRTRSVAFVRGSAWDLDPEDPFATCIMTFMLGANVTEHPLKLAAETAAAAAAAAAK
jgi:uncharacterized protein (TIGR00369 family)